MKNIQIEVGLDVYWYPGARIDGKTEPYVGKINKAWTLGVADLSILPVTDGAVMAKDQVWHREDPRLHDSYGNISPGGLERGCWEYTPQSKRYLRDVAKEAAEAAAAESEELEKQELAKAATPPPKKTPAKAGK